MLLLASALGYAASTWSMRANMNADGTAAVVLPPPGGEELKKKDWKQARKPLRRGLVALQRRLREEGDFPVLLLFAGVDGAGKHESINLLNHWMDPRFLHTLAYAQEPPAGPEMARYWRDLPPRGETGLVLSGWYSPPLLARVDGRDDDDAFARRLERIARFERALADDGALILKFWLHLDAEAQTRRLQKLACNADTAWRVDARAWRNVQRYDDFIAHTRTLLGATHAPHAPWQVLDGRHSRRRFLAIAQCLHDALDARLETPHHPPPQRLPHHAAGRLKRVDLSARLDKKEYKHRLRAAREQLAMLLRMRRQDGRATVLAFEGWDAAGKGGTIWRLVRGLDARDRRVEPIAAPDSVEATRHYLWRFWRQIPRPGELVIFDRSWYGRVLVERVEELAPQAVWQRAYDEINAFETELAEGGVDVLKFWLHISAEEQLARFRERERTARKQHKLTDEDWRNRARRDEYTAAVEEMLARTDTPASPWITVAADDKRHARVTVIEAVTDWLRGK